MGVEQRTRCSCAEELPWEILAPPLETVQRRAAGPVVRPKVAQRPVPPLWPDAGSR